jgi:hypothetical protein
VHESGRIKGALEVESRLKFGVTDKLLILAIVFSMIVSLIIPLPAILTKPGFSSYILFEDTPFLLPYFISLLSMGILWGRQGNRRFVALFLVIVFSLLTANLWQMKAPGLGLSYQYVSYGAKDAVSAASLTSSILETGRLVFAGYGSYPGIYLIGSSLTYVSGLSLDSVILLTSSLLSIIIAVFTFLVINLFSKSTSLTSAVTMLSIVADENLVKQPPYTQYYLGVIFFFIIIIFATGASWKKRESMHHAFPLIVLSLASILAYSITPFVVILIFAFSFFFGKAHRSFTRMLGFTVASYVAWSIYASLNELEALTNGFLGIFGVKNGIELTGAGHSIGYYLIQLLSTNISSLPYDLGYLLPAWFLVFFGFGTLAWIVMRLLRPRANLPPAYIVAALLVTGALVFFDEYPTGVGWDRLLTYIAPFIGATWLLVLSNRRSVYLRAIVGLILILTLPTIVAYTPDVGVISTHYLWQATSGSYLIQHMSGGNVYFGDSVLMLNYSFNSRMISAFPTGGLTPAHESDYVLKEIDAFSQSADGSVLVVSSLFSITYVHLFGYAHLANVTTEFDKIAEASSVVYSNGYQLVLDHLSSEKLTNP